MKKYRVTVDGQVFNVIVEEAADSNTLQNREPARSKENTPEHLSEIKAEPSTHRPPAGGFINVEAPMPGSIVEIAVKSGDEVKEGDVLLILEAMKMENEITAPQAGTVREIYVKAGDTVSTGDILLALS